MASYWQLTRGLAVFRDPYGIAERHDRFTAMTTVLDSLRDSSAKNLGFITNRSDPEIRSLLYFSAAWELAPRFVLANGTPSSRLVVGMFQGPVDSHVIAQTNGLSIMQDFGGGIVLFQRVSGN